jgi:hypothetical protein
MTSNQADDVSHIEKLNGVNNFHVWKMQIDIIFQSAGLDDFVTGSVKQETLTLDKDKKEFIQKDARAKKAIIASVSKTVLCHILHCKTSKEMMDKITKVYDRQNEDQVNELLQSFYAHNFDRSHDMAHNISTIQNVAFRLIALKQNITDEMIISKILAVLPPEYAIFRTAWGSVSKNDRTVDNLVTRLFAEENNIGKTENSANVAFQISKQKKTFLKKNQNSPICYKCNQPGHYKNSCPMQKSTYDTYDPIEKCRYCKKTNHKSERCYFRAKHEKRAINSKDKVAFLTQRSINSNTNELKFYVDSGSSSHMTNQPSILSNFKIEHDEVKVAKKYQSLTTTGVGTLDAKECILKDVILSPCLDSNLISVGAITENGGQVLFTHEKVLISKNNNVLQGEKQANGLYVLELTRDASEKLTCFQAQNSKKKDAMYWHRTLGHLSFKNLKQLNKENNLGITETDFKISEKTCEICLKAKQTRFPFSTERTRATRPLEIIHTDICQIEKPTWDGYTYILTFQDDYTCFKQIYLLKRKSDTTETLKQYVSEVESKWTLPVYKIRADNGGEYSNENLLNWAKSRGTIFDFTIPHTPQLNAKAERLNRSLMDKTRALLYDSHMPANMWGECARVACYILNRCLTQSLPDLKTPYEMWFGKKPDYNKMHLFGCTAHAKNLTRLQKLDSRSNKYCHVGYSPNGYRLWDENSQKIIYSRDVIFDEQITETTNNETNCEDVTISLEIEEMHEESREDNTEPSTQNNTEESDNFISNTEDKTENEYLTTENDLDVTLHENAVSEEEEEEEENFLRRGKRNRRPPEYLHDYVLLTYQEAVDGPDSTEWKKAINSEKSSLHKNYVFKFIPAKDIKEKKCISSRWVFRKKENGNFKARLVARGCEQRIGDYYETYSPVVNTSILRFLLAYAKSTHKTIMTFDVSSAFLYGNLSEELYMKLPEGFEEEQGKICLLQKSLYGLKQAPINWNKTLVDFLKKRGLNQLITDRSVFKNKDNSLILAIHVDDGLVIGDNADVIMNFLRELKTKFDITMDKEPKVYLGMELKNENENLILHQPNYINKILREFKMENAKNVRTPSTPGSIACLTPDRKYPYREAVGSLLYLSSRPDITFSVNQVSRNVENPTEGDVLKIKRIFRYLQGTKDVVIKYSMDKDFTQIDAFCDSDFANDEKTRRSTGGYIILYCGGAISWSTKRQTNIATNTAEAELISASECVKEVIFLKQFFQELTNENLNVNLYIDNQSTIKMIENGCSGKRSKHIDIKYKFTVEKVKQNNFVVKYCPSENQLADAFTKSLTPIDFERLRNIYLQFNM